MLNDIEGSYSIVKYKSALELYLVFFACYRNLKFQKAFGFRFLEKVDGNCFFLRTSFELLTSPENRKKYLQNILLSKFTDILGSI